VCAKPLFGFRFFAGQLLPDGADEVFGSVSEVEIDLFGVFERAEVDLGLKGKCVRFGGGRTAWVHVFQTARKQ
jgi:hypothetical protein